MKRILLSCAVIAIIWQSASLLRTPQHSDSLDDVSSSSPTSRDQVKSSKIQPRNPLADFQDVKHINLTSQPADRQSEKISNNLPANNKTIGPQNDDDEDPEDRTVWDTWVAERSRYLIDELEVSDDDVVSLDKIAETTGKDIRRLIRDLNATPPRIDFEKFSTTLDDIKQRHRTLVSELLDEQTVSAARDFQDKFNKEADEKFGDDIKVMEF